MKPVGFVTILLIGWFVYSVSSSFAVQAPLSLEQTSTTRFENVPPNFTYRVPTGAVARAKLFSFVLQSLTVEARLGDQIQTFQLTDIPAFARPKADSYQNQETIPPQFQIALQMQATKGTSYRLVSATYIARFALYLSFDGELDTVVQPPDEMTLQGTVNLDTPPFEALVPDVFLCIGLEIQQMAVDVSMQQEATTANFSFAQSPIVSSEFIVNDVRALSFTTTSDLPLQTQVVFRVDGMIHFALEYVCLTRSDYPLTEKDIRLGQPAQPAPARRNFNRNAQLNPELFQVLSAWPVDVQWFNQNGPLPGANTPAITTDRFNNQDRVYAQVTFKEGPKIGETVKTPSTFIPDHAPSIRSVEIIADPSPPITTSTLRILPQEWTDEDGDAENYRYYWFNQNGLIPGAESDILDGSYFQRGDTLFARIIPFDGIYEGAGVQTESTIRNAPPRFEALRVEIDTTMAQTNSVLTAHPIGWQDADGDKEGYQYIWYNQNGPLGVDFPNEETIKVQRVFPLNATAPLQLQRGITLNVPLIGIQEGTVRFISPSGRVIEHRIPEAQGSEIRGSLPVTLDEIGDYTIKETSHLIVRSTNNLIPVESRGEQQFTWTYANRGRRGRH
ncbi:hypothetical protein HYR99_38145 [Candidatus Poribacteria bacterium]|nr:hypothetical protein [Candidatus Poribacteria bacterium]